MLIFDEPQVNIITTNSPVEIKNVTPINFLYDNLKSFKLSISRKLSEAKTKMKAVTQITKTILAGNLFKSNRFLIQDISILIVVFQCA